MQMLHKELTRPLAILVNIGILEKRSAMVTLSLLLLPLPPLLLPQLSPLASFHMQHGNNPRSNNDDNLGVQA